ncbi:MAG TPA: EI24 domain-containing protein [Lacibacter sp.]|nr:EI24 domain-containing protein [Lacibacter sp.]HMO88848.1 EI24 domain-containing protein [Lacibacter sp.]HMP86693.1 EI24 domain-containing protein [Lacibacter sp.]
MLKELVIAIEAYFRAHRFIVRHKLWKWILIPGLLYALLFVTGMWLFWTSSGSFLNWLFELMGIRAWLESMRSEWLNFLFITGSLIFRLILLFFYFSLFKYLFLIVGAPLFAYLSEKTESILEDRDYPFSMPQFLSDVWRGIRLALRNLLWQTVYTVTILLFSLVPVVGWVSPLIAFLVECYYYGFSMLDYSAERHKLSPSQSIAFISGQKGLAIGNGMVFYLLHLLPLVGWVLAPAYAVVAATLSLYHTKDNP